MTRIEEEDLFRKIAVARVEGKTSLDKYPKKVPFSKRVENLVSGINQGAAEGNPVSMGVDLISGALNIPNPVGGSEWYKKMFLPPKAEPMDRLDKTLAHVGSGVGMMTSGVAGGEALAAKGAASLGKFLGGMTLPKAAELGVKMGAGASAAGALTDDNPLAEFAGILVGGAIPTPANLQAGLKPLLNETGAVRLPNPSGTVSKLNLWKQAGVGNKLSQIGDRLGSVPLLPEQSRLARYLNGNTVSQWATSPILRMPTEAGTLFKRNATEADRIGQSYRESALKLSNAKLNLDQLEDVKRVIRSGFDMGAAHDPANLPMIADFMKPVVDGTVTGIEKLAKTHEERGLLNQALNERLLKVFQEDPDHPLWRAEVNYTGPKFDLTSNEGTMKFLNHVLADPTVDPVVKQIARDNFDLPAKTAQEVANAHSNAYSVILKSKIINNPDWAIPQVDVRTKIMEAKLAGDTEEVARQTAILKDFVEIPRDPSFDGVLVHKTVAEGIKDFETHVSSFRKNWNKYFLNPWKFMKIGLNVPARPRDLVSNMIFNDVAGEFPLSPYRLDIYGPAMLEIKKALRSKVVHPDLKEYFKWSGGRPDALNSIALDPVFDAMRHNANPIDEILGGMYGSKVGEISAGAMRNVDLWSKYAKFKWNLKNGMSSENAAYDAMRVTGDHLMQTSAIKAVRDTAMPFFPWTVHAMKTMGEGLAQHPIRAAKYFAAPYLAGQAAIQELGLTGEEWEDIQKTLPEYLSSNPLGIPTHIPMPMRDEKGRIQLIDIGWWLPGLQDLSEMDQNVANPVRMMQNPAATLAASVISNKKFSGAPIWNEWDDPGTKAAKFFGYAGQQLLPPMTPYLGNQFNKIHESYNENNEDALTSGQAWASQVGGRVTPIDEKQQTKKFMARQDAFINEARRQMKREVESAKTDEDAQKAEDRYQDIIDRLKDKKNLE